MALDSLTATFTSSVNVTATKNQTGLANGLGTQNSDQKSHAFSKAIANASALGADEAYFLLLSIAGASSQDIDMSALVDASGTTVTLVGGRLKGWRFRLLGAAELAPDGTTAGTACSAITIGNAGANSHTLNLLVGAPTTTQQVTNGSCLQYADGTGTGFVVDATHKVIHIVNSDAVNTAKVLVTLIGATT